ncbi:MAG TPA: maltose alpha-D-glucosyltransferase [Burkholderiales bacterium]|nr:maltose alpha-D-glucosyltransferase [Burkholderiales bacterium]
MYTGDQPRAATPEAASEERDLWYRDAVVYQLHVKAFFDSNNDGVGDFKGLTSKLDYIQELGVNALWLLPFYPSPMKDDGYDVSNYHNVHPQYGTRSDFRNFVREAHRRGLKVITELVVNHTSDQHPWFQAARRAPPDSPKRHYYVWSDSDQKYKGTRIIFTDTETSNWAWDPVAKAHYWHRFFSHQPDLNFDNPHVLRAVFRTMQFWLDMGVDGFRLDAIPYLIEREGTSNENLPETHAVLKQLRAQIDEQYPNRLLLAEANMWPEDVRPYFGDGDECHMAFHFPLMPRMYMAIAQEDRHPVVEIMQQTPEIPDICQWAIFLRNHDELTLEMVTSRERDYMYRQYAADMQARINLGIRRRLAPLMENDTERVKLMNSLLLSMPGSPILYYGDEIGMGDNIYLGDRNGVRTPMQWSPDRNAGFSRADPQRLYLPPIMDAVYGYEAVNVEAQSRDPSSQLNWMKRMLAVRKSSHAFGRGRLSFLRPGNRKVLAYLREYGEEGILCVANLSRSAQPVELDLKRFKGRVPVELHGRTPFPPIGDLPYLLTMPAHAFYWFRLATDVAAPDWHKEMLVPDEAPVLVLFDGWTSFFRDQVVPWRMGMAEKLREQLEEQVLPRFVESQRWYAQKGEPVNSAPIKDHAVWDVGGISWLLSFLLINDTLYFLPLALGWEEDEDHVRALSALTVARVRQQANVGVLADAVADEGFCRHVVKAIGEGRTLPTAHGALRFTPTKAYRALAGEEVATLTLGQLHTQSTNTSATLGDRLFLKCYRRVRAGLNPELEIGRFLTETAKFSHCVPLAGVVEYASEGSDPAAVALLQGYVPNQGDGWGYTLAYLERFLEQKRADEGHGAYLALVQTLATRTAELHIALAMKSGNPAFDPEPFTAQDMEAWERRVREEANQTLALIEKMPPNENTKPLLERRARIFARIDACAAPKGPTLKTRHHGDYHLGQVLLANNDFYIIDFEGEPSRPLAESRRKHTPLRDVAGMLRSFSYAKWSALVSAAEKEPVLDSWEAEARRSFLAAYADAAGRGRLYASFDDVRGLLELAEIEKLLYELRYELANRPAWVHIPLQGLLALIDSSPKG